MDQRTNIWTLPGFPLPSRAQPDLLREATDLKSALVSLRTAWQQLRDSSRSPRSRDAAELQINLLMRCEQQLAEAWRGADFRIPPLVRTRLGERPWWWSGALPAGRRVAIVSSRLPRRLDPQGAWLQGLRAALAYVRERNSILVIGHGSAGHEFIARGAVRLGIPTILLRCCDAAQGEAWPAQWRSSLQQRSSANVTEAWALPLWDHTADAVDTAEGSLRRIPERDRAAVAWADEVIVLGLRARGNLESLLRQRLATRPASVLLADLPGLQPRALRDELVTSGATFWTPVSHEPTSENCASTDSPGSQPVASVVLRPPSDGWQFLTHSTRACLGPWPDQSQDDYHNSLIEADPGSDHSPLSTLLRIISQRRLLASHRTIRGGFPVVSFTAVPLAELPQLRTFRSHRTRWDFEPYGLCIRREWLEQHGARPVHYGDESTWRQFAPADQPFFQLAQGAPRRRPGSSEQLAGTDWTVEREWRLLGDVDLSQLTPVDALIFVPTPEAARAVLAVSPWPVTLLPIAVSKLP